MAIRGKMQTKTGTGAFAAAFPAACATDLIPNLLIGGLLLLSSP